jgi:hypothetical protein
MPPAFEHVLLVQNPVPPKKNYKVRREEEITKRNRGGEFDQSTLYAHLDIYETPFVQ